MNEAGEHSVEIVLKDPAGAEVVRLNGEIKVGVGPTATGGRVRVPQVVNMERLVFQKPGGYSFDVSVDGEHQVSVPLFLHDATPRGSVAQA